MAKITGKDIIDDLKKEMERIENLKPLSYYQKDFMELLTALAVHDELNFYAHMIFNMDANLSYSVPTAGIYYKNERFHIDFNPAFIFETLHSREDRLYICIHEVLHALYLHFNRVGSRDKKLWNIAGDISINQFLFKRLSQDSILKEVGCSLGPDFDFPENLSTEQYYELLLKKQEENKANGKGDVSDKLNMDDLMESDEISEIEKEIIKDQLKDIIKKARDKCKGSIPDEILSIIDILFTQPVVDWRTHLRHITGNKRINKETTIKRRARRFQDRSDINGKVKRSGFSVACLVDVSGSMMDEEITRGLSEIKSICDWSNSTMTLVQVDTEASVPEEFSSFDRKFTRKRKGGTYLYPGIEKLDEYEIEYNALIVITDGEIEESWPEVLNIPVFFLTTTGTLSFDISVSDMYKKFDLNK